MRNLSNVLPLLLPLTLLALAGCPKKTATEPSLPKPVHDRPVLLLPAGLTAVPGIADAEQLAVGDEHACVIRAGGRVFCWGDNTEGALGLPEKKVYETPVEIPEAADAVEIAAGTSTTCVRKKSGVVYCWSGAQSPAVDEPLTLKRQEMPTLKGALHLGVGFLHVCGAFTDGTVRCARVPQERQYQSIYSLPEAFEGVPGVTSLRVGSHFLCARLAGGGVRCMGANWGGEIGNGGDGKQDEPVSPRAPTELTPEQYEKSFMQCPGSGLPGCGGTLSGVVDLDVSSGNGCAALADGSIACWGSFERGDVDHLGVGKLGFSRVPVKIGGFSDATAVAAGTWHACALVKDGQVACVGDNSQGQLGDDTKTDSKTAKVIPQLSGMTQLGAGDTFTCALHGTGQVVCWGTWRIKYEE